MALSEFIPDVPEDEIDAFRGILRATLNCAFRSQTWESTSSTYWGDKYRLKTWEGEDLAEDEGFMELIFEDLETGQEVSVDLIQRDLFAPLTEVSRIYSLDYDVPGWGIMVLPGICSIAMDDEDHNVETARQALRDWVLGACFGRD